MLAERRDEARLDLNLVPLTCVRWYFSVDIYLSVENINIGVANMRQMVSPTIILCVIFWS